MTSSRIVGSARIMHEMRYSKRETKKEKKRKINFPLCTHKVEGLVTDRFPPTSFIVAVASHNCGISSRSGAHPPGNTPCIPPHKPQPFTRILNHFPCLPDIQTFSLNSLSHYQSVSFGLWASSLFLFFSSFCFSFCTSFPVSTLIA